VRRTRGLRRGFFYAKRPAARAAARSSSGETHPAALPPCAAPSSPTLRLPPELERKQRHHEDVSLMGSHEDREYSSGPEPSFEPRVVYRWAAAGRAGVGCK
jgi:hypothetical protein